MERKTGLIKNTAEELRLQLGFEKQITSLFSKFLNLPSNMLDDAINDACRTIGIFTRSSRCVFILVSETGLEVERTYEWCFEGIAPFTGRCFSKNVNSILASTKTAPEAGGGSSADERQTEKKGAVGLGVASSLYVPLMHEGRLWGITGVESLPDERKWSPDIRVLLTAAGEIFIHAVARKRTEEQLAYKQNVLAILMDNIPDTNIYFKDLNSRFTTMNKAQAGMMGLSDPAQAIGKADSDFFDDTDQFLADEQKIIKTGTGLIGKLEKVIKQNGTFHWYSSTKMPVRDNSGLVIGTFGISRDVTQLKEYEDELQKAKDLLEIRVEERTADLKKTNERLESHIAQLNFLDAASFELSQIMFIDALLPAILALFLKRFPRAQGGLCRMVKKSFICTHSTGIFDSDSGKSTCSAICNGLHHAGFSKLFVIRDWKNDERARGFSWPGLSGFTSYIALPLCVDASCIAVLQIFISEELYSGQEDRLLTTLAAHSAICLSNALRLDELKAKARLDGELEAARSIQTRFTPHHKPPIPRINLKGVYYPAHEVGGDYLDYFQTENGAWIIVVADICGKGIPAALLMTMLRSTFRIEAKYETSARDLLCSVNKFLVQNVDDRSFVTALCLVVSSDGRQMSYARAGHPKLVRLDTGANIVKEVSARGMALGLSADTDMFRSMLEEVTILLNKGDSYLIYTDGLIEATDPDNKQYGFFRLREALVRNRNSDPEILIVQLMEDIKKFTRGAPNYDDLTILAMEVI